MRSNPRRCFSEWLQKRKWSDPIHTKRVPSFLCLEAITYKIIVSKNKVPKHVVTIITISNNSFETNRNFSWRLPGIHLIIIIITSLMYKFSAHIRKHGNKVAKVSDSKHPCSQSQLKSKPSFVTRCGQCVCLLWRELQTVCAQCSSKILAPISVSIYNPPHFRLEKVYIWARPQPKY